MTAKKIHYIYGFKDKELKFYEYINMLLCSRVIKPERIIFHTAQELNGKWFSLLKNNLINLEIRMVDTTIDSNKMNSMVYYAHKADYYRLYMLNKEGGIYFDVDVFPYKPLDKLLKYNKTVLGIQKGKGLCNAVIIAPENDPFLSIWLSTYSSFKNSEWDKHSVVIPFELSKKYPGFVKVLNEKAFFYPLWHNNLKEILSEEDNFIEEGYCCHLWKTVCGIFLNKISPDFIIKSDSFYAKTVRKYVSLEEIMSWND